MALFGKKRPVSLFGPEVSGYLAAYGAFDFDARSHEMPGTDVVMWMSRLQDLGGSADASRAVGELSQFAQDVGGWTAVGASAAIYAFFPNEVGSEPAFAAEDARIRYLRSRGARPTDLSYNDQQAWNRVFA